ncbi:MAG: hypothetical protein IJ291_00370 [Lachnospiraceae bacterium]|nr:hypothetical protein [Lachnospiraceae bacterium]
MITLNFDKLYNRDRIAQPCYVSVPFPKGALTGVDCVSLKQNDRILPVQKKVLSSYQDGSVKYLFLRFLADIPANKGAQVILDTDCVGVTAPETTLTLQKENGVLRVLTGNLEFTVSNGGTLLFDEIKANGTLYAGKQFEGSLLKDKKGGSYNMVYGDWSVVEEGPVCVILSNAGKLVPADGSDKGGDGILCETRLSAYPGRSYVETEIRLVNATDEVLEIASWEYKIAMEDKEAKIRTCVASSNYTTSFDIGENGETKELHINTEFLMNEGNEHFPETFYGTFFADYTTEEAGICATVYQAQQNYPKAIVADKSGIIIRLVPEGDLTSVMQSGMAVKQRFQLYFHDGKEELQEINHQSIMYQMPDCPVLDSEIYDASGLFPNIFVPSEKKNDDVECGLMMAADIHGRSYGMMNWGDTPDVHYTAQGRGQGELIWTNNEYDFPHACMLQFIRTGIRRYMDYCVVTGTHQRDVDVCHYSQNPLVLGGQWEHTKGHCVDGRVVCSHQWAEGLLDCYHVTGDERFLEAAIGIGENVLRLLDTPEYKKTGGLNARETGWALRTLAALYRENYDKKWVEKADWIVEQFKEWADLYGGWLAPYTDNTAIRVPFMISVAVGSLMRYYREFPRDDIKEMIVNAVDDMLENCLLENGYFYYKELPTLTRVGNNPLVLEALTIAYELTGKSSYLEYGIKTFKYNITGCISGTFAMSKKVAQERVHAGMEPTKKFAQLYVPITTYYKALADCDML